jgi:hypothetical protein
MNKLKGKTGSYFHNNLVIARKYDHKNNNMLVNGSGDDVTVSLNGYAIIPIEDYHQLNGLKISDNEIESIENMDKKLHL